MADEAESSVAGFPPRPDPRTGFPSPPTPPSIRVIERDADRDRRIKRVRKGANARPAPRQPRGQQPALTWMRIPIRARIISCFGLFVLMTVLFIGERGFDWVSKPVGWLILLVVSLPMIVAFMDKGLAAGADWVRRGRKWVRVYELKSVHATREGGDVEFVLTDVDERWVKLRATELNGLPQLWALVYNGIRHSAAAGMTMSGSAAFKLELPRSAESRRGKTAASQRKRGPWYGLLGVLLMIASITSIIVPMAMSANERWFSNEGFDAAMAAGLCLLAQLMIGAIAVSLGDFFMVGALGAITFLAVGACIFVGPIGLGIGIFASRATGVVAGMIVSVTFILAAIWLLNNHARVRFILKRLGAKSTRS